MKPDSKLLIYDSGLNQIVGLPGLTYDSIKDKRYFLRCYASDLLNMRCVTYLVSFTGDF